MKQFNEIEQTVFWTENNEPFKGDYVANVTLSLAKKYIGKKVVDIGAGSGALMSAFKRKYENRKQISALDLVPKGPDIQKGDCTILHFDDAYFDTYFSTDVIEHLSDEDLDKCLNEANRVLVMKGYGIFSTVNNERLSASTVVCPECQCKFHRWGHCQVFTESRIRALFQKKGFAVVEVKTINLKFIRLFGLIGRMVYWFHVDTLLNILLKYSFFDKDLFFVVKKVRAL